MTAGRPKSYDYDDALNCAMRVFWEKGFDGTTMPDLTEAMNMNRPSIYAAFGNKEDLFKKTLALYAEKSVGWADELLNVPRIEDAVERFLLGSADSLTSTDKPRGCLAVQSALVGGDDTRGARDEAAVRREVVFNILEKRFERAVSEGQLKEDAKPRELARFYATVLQGMSVQSVSGIACADLRAIAQQALSVLPIRAAE